ncbi:MAG: PAS domain-containing protein [Betaproteobacteria bacterium]
MSHSHRLETTIEAVREVMAQRLKAGSLDTEAKREVEMALEMLDLMWEELQGQAALLERETERHTEFFDCAPDAYLITDAGGNVREANRAAREMLGEAPAGRPVASLVPEDDRVSFLSRFVGAISQPEGRLAWQGRVRGPGGEPLAAQFSVRAMPLRKSGVAGLCWLIRPL